MSIFKVSIVACNPKNGGQITMPIAALVNTGSELTWLPGEMLRAIGIEPQRRRTFPTSTYRTVERETGFVILQANGYETREEVVFAEPGDATLIGVRALEGFGITLDSRKDGFVAIDTLAAFSRHTLPVLTLKKAA